MISDELVIISIIQFSWQVVFLAKIYTPKIGPKGQMTLPKEIRAALELDEGDRVLLKVEPDGKVVLEKAIIMSASKRNQLRHATES